MPVKPRPPTKFSPKPPRSDGDGNHIHNQILLGLPAKESELLLPKLEFMRLRTHHVLHEPGDTLKSAYFCDSGLVSILSSLPGRKECGSRPGRQGRFYRGTAGCRFSDSRNSGHRSD